MTCRPMSRSRSHSLNALTHFNSGPLSHGNIFIKADNSSCSKRPSWYGNEQNRSRLFPCGTALIVTGDTSRPVVRAAGRGASRGPRGARLSRHASASGLPYCWVLSCPTSAVRGRGIGGAARLVDTDDTEIIKKQHRHDTEGM